MEMGDDVADTDFASALGKVRKTRVAFSRTLIAWFQNTELSIEIWDLRILARESCHMPVGLYSAGPAFPLRCESLRRTIEAGETETRHSQNSNPCWIPRS
jgi:hypothetical protein